MNVLTLIGIMMDTNTAETESSNQLKLNQKLLNMMKQASKNPEIVLLRAVQGVIDSGADVNTRDDAGNLPLILAARNGLTTIVTKLLSVPGILVNECDQVDKKGHTALMEAAFYNHSATIMALLSAQNIDVNKEDSNGQTALMKAADRPISPTSDVSVTALLSYQGILVNQQNVHGDTALMQAILAGNTPGVIALLTAPGLSISLVNSKSETAISIAFKNGLHEMVKLLKEHGAVLPSDLAQKEDLEQKENLAQQVEHGWLKKLKHIFSYKLNFEIPNLDHIINHSAGFYHVPSHITGSKPSVTFSYDASRQKLSGIDILQEGQRPNSSQLRLTKRGETNSL
jgi:ankyrin repeat protein